MNKTQVAIVATVVAVLGMTGVLVFKNTIGASSKIDVLGIVPGMTHAQVERVIKQRKWLCRSVVEETLECKTDAGQMQIDFAKSLDKAPVLAARIHLLNLEKLSIADVATSISQQYGSKPGGGSSAGYQWALGNGLRLALDATPDLTLALTSPSLQEQDAARKVGK